MSHWNTVLGEYHNRYFLLTLKFREKPKLITSTLKLISFSLPVARNAKLMPMWYLTHLERMPQCPNIEAFKLAARRTALYSEVVTAFPPQRDAFACFDRGFSSCHLTQCVTRIGTQQISTGISGRISPLVNRIGANWPSSHWFLSFQSTFLGTGKYKKICRQFFVPCV